MDFFNICTKEDRKGQLEAFPDFVVVRSKDLMVRGGRFYAVWDNAKNMWSTDEYDVQRLVDEEIAAHVKEHPEIANVKYMKSFGTNAWNQFRKFLSQIADNSHQLDQHLTFQNTETKKSDYVSRRLDYSLAPGDHSAWDEVVSTLYSQEERAKIEWGIGSVVAGDSPRIQKFLVFYGRPGTGKGTILDVILKMFDGYTTTFEAKALVSNANFATEVFQNNPLVGVQHDGDLSRIEDNTKLNSIVSHEIMTLNVKYKSSYSARILAFLFMGTNLPVRITDGKSGIIRRLIDVHPSGNVIDSNRYQTLISRIDFELGAIAQHCLEVYRSMGKTYYNGYRPIEMMYQTDIFFNFIEANYEIFFNQHGVSLKQAYALYLEFCESTGIDKKLPQYKVRDELRNYFEEFKDRMVIDGVTVRSYYSGFKTEAIFAPSKKDYSTKTITLVLDETKSLLDEVFANQPAQYAKADGNPKLYWTNTPRLIDGEMVTPKPSQVVSTTLSDLDTTKEHYVQAPKNHLVFDFDLKGPDGRKSLERNLEAASRFPPTYAELSKSADGIHLHYNYTGPDVSRIASVFSEGIEIKSFAGNASLRRRFSRSNSIPIADISDGLPLKETKVLDLEKIKSERGLRELILRNLRKEIHPGTKPSIDFINQILEDAYASGIPYDVANMQTAILSFASRSTNQSDYCIKLVAKMKFKSKENQESVVIPVKDDRMVFFDCEVFPNLFVLCWSFEDSDTVVPMINPTPQEIEALFQFKLVGYNNLDYDNHILYGRYVGYTNEQLYRLSKRIIDEKKSKSTAKFGQAYAISYTDVLDFSSVKQSLKAFQIQLGIFHLELDLPWDEPVADEDIPKVVEYCTNDVISLKAVFNDRRGDFLARQILSELSGLTVNDRTAKHTAQIIFGDDKYPQSTFVYPKLAKEFPGYVFEMGKSTYKDMVTGEGGLVYAEPGVYENVVLLDIASMHPTTIRELNLFGDEYTPKFWDLVEARLAIKHKDFESARTMLDGRLAPYLINAESDPGSTKVLQEALKIAINQVYGLTSTSYDNRFRDRRNIDNVVAKRGALFMLDLKEVVEEKGFSVIHIKTDSIKIPNADLEIIEFVKNFGSKYGYTFEYKPETDFYDKFALITKADYVARNGTKWSAVGAQFQHPYVYKALFSMEDFVWDDFCETRQVREGAIYMDFDVVKPMAMVNSDGTSSNITDNMHFIGRTGRFVPVKPGYGGGILYRVKDNKAYAVSGTSNFVWAEAETAAQFGMECIDMTYFEKKAEAARAEIDHFSPFSEFVA